MSEDTIITYVLKMCIILYSKMTNDAKICMYIWYTKKSIFFHKGDFVQLKVPLRSQPILKSIILRACLNDKNKLN